MKPISEPPALVRPDESVSALIAQAKDLCGEIRQHDKLNLSRAVEVGKLLVKLKELRHKTWETTLKEIGVSRGRAWEYMEIAKAPARALLGCESIREAARLARTEPSENGAVISRAERLNIHKPTPFVLREPGDDTETEKPATCDANGRAHKPTRKPQPPPREELKDRLGNVVPDSCRDAFADPSLAQMIEELELIESSIVADPWVKKAGKLTAHYPFLLITKFDEHVNEALHRVQVALEALRAAVPYAVCPKCKGIDSNAEGKCCKGCRGCGHVPEHRYAELK